MQPHTPFFETGDEGRRDITRVGEMGHCWNWWYAVMRWEVSSDELEELYCSNLEYVCSEVDKLLNNFDAEDVVITSDHTNLVGEMECMAIQAMSLWKNYDEYLGLRELQKIMER